MKAIKILTILFLAGSSAITAQESNAITDTEAVENAIRDYVDALYTVEPSKIERSVDTTLNKIGYWYDEENDIYRDNLKMTYQQLYDLAGSWNAEGDKINDESPKEILIYEVNDKTAVAKLTAAWGIDIFHLAKVDDKWKIYNIIWQSHPK
jgi:hypothetical protein